MKENTPLTREDLLADCPIHQSLGPDGLQDIFEKHNVPVEYRKLAADLVLLRGMKPWYLNDWEDEKFFSSVSRFFDIHEIPEDIQVKLLAVGLESEGAWIATKYNEYSKPALTAVDNAKMFLSQFPEFEQTVYGIDFDLQVPLTVDPLLKLNEWTRPILRYNAELEHYVPVLAINGKLDDTVPIDTVAFDLLRSIFVFEQFPQSGYEKAERESLQIALDKQFQVYLEYYSIFPNVDQSYINSLSAKGEQRENLYAKILGIRTYLADFGLAQWEQICDRRVKLLIPWSKERKLLISNRGNINAFLNARARFQDTLTGEDLDSLRLNSTIQERSLEAAGVALNQVVPEAFITLHTN